ncbi:MAG: MATE family efflux transporter [Oscillospiraceae bacterium]|nr:MATE family efflux transporter [Oscillospiraceae bacterium]
MNKGTLTEGTIWKKILIFALPLMASQFLQQFYNTIDAIVVGNYVSNQALAAVGITGPIVNMIVAFFAGVSTGASVIISQYTGAEDHTGVSDAVHTSMSLAILLGVLLSFVGYFVSPGILKLMKTPEDMMQDAASYLRVYFIGLVGLTIYNIGAAILNASGDSKRPLYFLIVSTIFHTAVVYVLVAVFDMGIVGAALATTASQVLSSILVVVSLMRSDGFTHLNLRALRIDKYIVKRITSIGIPAALQQSIVSISNIVVTSYINALETITIAGYSVAQKADGFLMIPTFGLGLSTTTFVGQNLGAKQVQRARKGVSTAIILNLSITAVLSVFSAIFIYPLLGIFTSDQEVILAGYDFLMIYSVTRVLLTLTNILPGALRGSGDVKVATWACIGSFVVLRQIYLAIVTKYVYSTISIMLCYPITWAIAGIIIIFHYRRSDWSGYEPKVSELST